MKLIIEPSFPSKSMTKKEFGIWGEQIAANYLVQSDVVIIGKNVRTQSGEIDIIGTKDGVYIFFEVKTRGSTRYGNPEDAVNNKKQEHMKNSALEYIQSSLDLDIDWRIDVISIQVHRKNNIEIQWFKNAISN
jgi:putative endonuclease